MKIIKLSGLFLNLHGTQALFTDGLLRLYRGNGDTTDSTGNGPDLIGETGYADVSFPQSGTSRKVFDYANVLNGLRGSASGLPSGSSSRSTALWVMFPVSPSYDRQTPFGYGKHTTNQDWTIEAKSNEVNLDRHSQRFTFLTPRPTDSAWYHIVMTYDQSTNIIAVYLNGQYQISETPTTIPNTNVDDLSGSHPARIFIGHFVSDSTNTNRGAWKGKIADVAIFNRVITADEVASMYQDDNWNLNGGGGGDPHLVGFGGHYYTWQGQCSVVLLTYPPRHGNEDDGLDIQIRTRRVRKWSAIDSVAIKTGAVVAEVDSKEAQLFLNHSEVTLIKTTRMKVDKATSKKAKMFYKFILDGDKYLDITVNTKTDMIYLSLHGNYPKESKGILGSPANPGLFGRDGKVMEGDVNSFVEGWQVNDKDPKLFRTSTFPQYPEKCAYKTQQNKANSSSRERKLKQKDTVGIEEAIAACTNHPPGPLKQYCIDDVVQTGELEVADDKFYG